MQADADRVIPDEALIAVNQIMMMETYALADSGWMGHFHHDLSSYESYKARLVRIDLLARRGSKDPIEHCLRKYLRMFWFSVRSRGIRSDAPDVEHKPTNTESRMRNAYQNTTRIAEFLARFIFAMLAGTALILPLVILTRQEGMEAQLTTIVVFIVLFSLLVALLSKASNQEVMAASAAYAAVLVVFISSSN